MPFGIVSSVVGGLFGRSNAIQQQQAQQHMYRHRHRWQVEDMRKAGLNPVLSAMQGAPVPGSAAMAATPDFSAGIGKVASARLAREQINTEREQQATQREQQNYLAAQSAKAYWDAKTASYEAYKQHEMAELWNPGNAMSTPLRVMRALNDVGMPPGALVNSGVDLFRSLNPLDVIRQVVSGSKKKGPLGYGGR